MSVVAGSQYGFDQVTGGDTTTGDGFSIDQYSINNGYGSGGGGTAGEGFNSASLTSAGIYCSEAFQGTAYIQAQTYIIEQVPSNGENFLYDPQGWYGLGAGALAIGGTLYQNYYSDAKYKENVVEIANALDRVNAIRGVEFDWNNLANEEQGRIGHDVGVIAQEVQAVYPHAVREVHKEREDHVVTALVVDYEKLIPLLLQSIKELSAEVTSLKQQVNGTNI